MAEMGISSGGGLDWQTIEVGPPGNKVVALTLRDGFVCAKLDNGQWYISGDRGQAWFESQAVTICDRCATEIPIAESNDGGDHGTLCNDCYAEVR